MQEKLEKVKDRLFGIKANINQLLQYGFVNFQLTLLSTCGKMFFYNLTRPHICLDILLVPKIQFLT